MFSQTNFGQLALNFNVKISIKYKGRNIIIMNVGFPRFLEVDRIVDGEKLVNDIEPHMEMTVECCGNRPKWSVKSQ